MLRSRQEHTPGPQYYRPDGQRSLEDLLRGIMPLEPSPTSATTDISQLSSPSDGDSTGNGDNDEEVGYSQVEVLPVTGMMPKKRCRPNSPEKKSRSGSEGPFQPVPVPDSSPTDPTHAHNPTSDSNFVLFTTPPFTTCEEFKAIIHDFYIKPNAAGALGFVKHARKKMCNKSYLVAQFFDGKTGNHIISNLQCQSYCRVPLEPHWARIFEWSYFFTIYDKESTHGDLGALATSILVQKIKHACPLSHHEQLNELLCSANNTSLILETYQSWFRDQESFSPFGKIEN